MKISVTLDEYGDPGRIRTCDLRIRSPLLYPAELRAPQIGKDDLPCIGLNLDKFSPQYPERMEYSSSASWVSINSKREGIQSAAFGFEESA